MKETKGTFSKRTMTFLLPSSFLPRTITTCFLPILRSTLAFTPTTITGTRSVQAAKPFSGIRTMSVSNGIAGMFELTPSSSLVISKGDITAWSVDGATDAIVNAANERMLGGGGVDGAIHRAAGPELRAACWNVPEVRPGVRCPTGEARITPGFRLPVSRVIHTVGPIYDAEVHPEAFLTNAYRSCLRLAKENGIRFVAFPAISCGVYGYPFKEASDIAISVVKEFANDFKQVHFVLFSDDIYTVWIDTANELF